jgi:hypothetical protein
MDDENALRLIRGSESEQVERKGAPIGLPITMEYQSLW